MLRRTGSRRHFAIAVWAAALLLIATTAAADVNVSADVDRAKVRIGERLTLSITVEGSLRSAATPKLPDEIRRSFDVYSSGSSRNFSMSGGGVSSAISFRYTLVAREEGTITIPPIPIRVGNSEQMTKAFDVTVLPAAASAPARSRANAGAASDAGPQDISFVSSVDKDVVYEGEEIVLTLTFATRVNLLDRPQFDPPRTTGFVVERLPESVPRDEIIGGRRYSVQEIRYALFPIGTGEKTIGSAKITCSVPARRRSRDPFSVFGSWMDGRAVAIESDPVPIRVRSLPETDEPSFTGAVGSFEMTAAIDVEDVVQNDPVTLTIVVEGVGNLGSAGTVDGEDTDQFRVFDASTDVEPLVRGGRLGGRRTIKRAFVPLEPGALEIPEIRFTYFDPEGARYTTIRRGPFPILVRSAKTGSETPVVVGKGEVRLLREDVRYVHTDPPRFGRVGDTGRSWAWLVHLVPILALGVALIWRRHTDRLSTDHAYSRARQASGRAKKRIREAKTADHRYHAELWTAVGGFVADRLDAPSSLPTAVEAERLLVVAGCDSALAGKVRSFGDRCDFARFAPGETSEELTRLRDTARDLVKSLEGEPLRARSGGRRR